jgi:hypothetical protein
MQPELTSFLRKANRQLRQASLVALEALLAKYGASLSTDSTNALVPEAAALLDDAGVFAYLLCAAVLAVGRHGKNVFSIFKMIFRVWACISIRRLYCHPPQDSWWSGHDAVGWHKCTSNIVTLFAISMPAA